MCLLWFCMAKTKSHCVGSHSSAGEIRVEDLTHVLIFFWKKYFKLQFFEINVDDSIIATTITEQYAGRANHTSPWACQVCQKGLCRLKGPVAPGLWVSFTSLMLQPKSLAQVKSHSTLPAQVGSIQSRWGSLGRSPPKPHRCTKEPGNMSPEEGEEVPCSSGKGGTLWEQGMSVDSMSIDSLLCDAWRGCRKMRKEPKVYSREKRWEEGVPPGLAAWWLLEWALAFLSGQAEGSIYEAMV